MPGFALEMVRELDQAGIEQRIVQSEATVITPVKGICQLDHNFGPLRRVRASVEGVAQDVTD